MTTKHPNSISILIGHLQPNRGLLLISLNRDCRPSKGNSSRSNKNSSRSNKSNNRSNKSKSSQFSRVVINSYKRKQKIVMNRVEKSAKKNQIEKGCKPTNSGCF